MRGDEDALDVAAQLLHDAEEATGVGLTMWLLLGPTPLVEEDVSDATVGAFLDASSLVVDGCTMQTAFVLVNREGRELLFSFRDWGHQVAAWGNRTFPPSRSEPPSGKSPCSCEQCRSARPGDWLYIDFYMASYLAPFFTDYERWLDAVEAMVRRKVERFGPPFGIDASPR